MEIEQKISLLKGIRDHTVPLSDLYDSYFHDAFSAIKFTDIINDLANEGLIEYSDDGQYARVSPKGHIFIKCDGDMAHVSSHTNIYGYNDQGEWVEEEEHPDYGEDEDAEYDYEGQPEESSTTSFSDYLIRILLIHLFLAIFGGLMYQNHESKPKAMETVSDPISIQLLLDSKKEMQSVPDRVDDSTKNPFKKSKVH